MYNYKRKSKYFPKVFTSYISFGYYIAFIPFCIKFSKSSKKYKVECFMFQRVFCGLLHILIAILNVLSIIRRFSRNNRSKAQDIFGLFMGTCRDIQVIGFIYVGWRWSSRFLHIVNLTPTQSEPSKKIWVALFTVVGCVIQCGKETFHYAVQMNGSLEAFVGYVKFLTFQEANEQPYNGTITDATKFMAFVVLSAGWLNSLHSSFATFLTLVVAGAIYEVANDFKVSLSQEVMTNSDIIKAFMATKAMITEINSALNGIFIWTFPYFIGFMCEAVYALLDNTVSSKIRILSVLGSILIIVYLVAAAESSYQMQECVAIILERICNEELAYGKSRSVAAVYIEASSNTGFRGSNAFTVTYGFLGTTINVVLTLVLVLIQLVPLTVVPQKTL